MVALEQRSHYRVLFYQLPCELRTKLVDVMIEHQISSRFVSLDGALGRGLPPEIIAVRCPRHFRLRPGRGDHFNCVRIPGDNNRGANTLLTTEIGENPVKCKSTPNAKAISAGPMRA